MGVDAGVALANAPARCHMRSVGKFIGSASARLAVTNEMFAEEVYHARVQVSVQPPVEVHRIVDAYARYGSHKLRRARCQDREMAGWHNMNLRFARQAFRDARSP